jgi:ketosteroid isomerase-like protein
MNREQTEQEVAQLANTWIAAELRGDTIFLEQRLADDFVGVGPLGFLLSKQEWIARHQSGDMKYTAHTLDEIKVRAYHEAVNHDDRLIQQATYQGNPMNVQMRATLVFIRQQEQWRLRGCTSVIPPCLFRTSKLLRGGQR